MNYADDLSSSLGKVVKVVKVVKTLNIPVQVLLFC